jgi:hypothetical protein
MYSSNEYDEVYNSEETFDALAADLKEHSSVVVHWIDQRGTLLNVLFAQPHYVGGSRDNAPLFVAIWGRGAYSFSGFVDPVYASEKLGIRGLPTLEPLCELINAVLERL